MKTFKFIQRDGERKLYALDYSAWLAVGETVTNAAFTVLTSTSPALVVSNIQYLNANTGVAYFVSGGVAGERYEVSVVATTSTAELKEDKIYFSVVE